MSGLLRTAAARPPQDQGNTASPSRYFDLRALAALLVLFALAHGMLVLRNVQSPDAFINTDRGIIRQEKIAFVFDGAHLANLPELSVHPVFQRRLEGAADWGVLDRLARLGPPGDYAIHGALLSIGGQPLVVGLQLTCAMFATLVLVAIGRELDLSPTLAAAVAIVHIFLPLSLVFPHQLATEAFTHAFLILVAWTAGRAIRTGDCRFLGYAISAGLVCAILRPQFLALVPILGLLFWYRWRKVVPAVVAVCAPITLLAGWQLFVWHKTGTFAIGESDFSLGYNLALQVERVARIYNLASDGVVANGTIDLTTFARFVAAHFGAFISFRITENINLLANPGINQLLGDFLGIDRFDFVGPDGGPMWHRLRGELALPALLVLMLQQDTLWLIPFLGAVLVWLLCVVGAAIGLVTSLRERSGAREQAIVLLVIMVYTLVVVQAALLRPAHRNAIDFILVLFAGRAIQSWLRGGRDGVVGRWRLGR